MALRRNVVAVRRRGLSPDALAARLRQHEPPVFARIQDDRLLMDVRTLRPGDAEAIAAAFRGLP